MGSLQDALLEAGLVDKNKLDESRRGNRASSEIDTAKSRGQHKKKHRRKKKTSGHPGSPSRIDRPKSGAQVIPQNRKPRLSEQEMRRRRNLELDGVVNGHVLNCPDAEIPRYFEHLGRIRRVLCTPEQRARINAGDLSVVALRGSYLIVDPDVAERYRLLAPDLVPDLSGREPAADDDGYPPVPDDLTW